MFLTAIGPRATKTLVSLALGLSLSGAAQASVMGLAGQADVVIEADNQLITNVGSAPANVVNLSVGADRFYNAGIFGQNTVTANVEAGHIWNGHETLGHVTVFQNVPTAWDTDGNPATPEYDRHATWVGMHIGGRPGGAVQGDHQVGIAPGTDLRSGAIATAWNGSAYATGFGATFGSFTQPYNAFFGTADVINSSWGGTDASGSGFVAQAIDGFANMNPNTTFVSSAGNTSPAAGPNSVGSPGSGYNGITVAALQNDGANNYNAVAAFSNRGPQDYSDPVNGLRAGMRAAVDIAAPGTNLVAAYYGGQTGGNNPLLPGSPDGPAGGPNFYTSGVQGTSFAAPIVAGGAALIDSASRNDIGLAGNAASRDARVVKAVLMNSARKIPGWNNGQVAHANGNGGVITTQSLDWNSGAGALNLDRAFDQYLAGTRDVSGTGQGNLGPVGAIGWDYGVVAQGIDNIYQIATPLVGGSNFYVTLDWFRERLFNALTFDVFDLAQANLDLLIRDTVTNLVISESVSLYNVVEHLAFVLPRTSLYQIEVSFTGTTFDLIGLNAEAYGLAWWGTAVVPVPGGILLVVLGLGLMRRRMR